jgi:type IX secretion system PorP/SprF family membrane protein
MKSLILKFFFLSMFINQSYGQSLVYSQYYASPLTSNPGLTGVFKGTTRLCANYRSQWNNINSNSALYNTPSLSVDVSIPEKNLAFGFVFVNDQTNDKIFNTLEAGASVGYKLRFNLFEISMGIQGWYKQIYFDPTKVESSILAVEPNLLDNYTNLDLNTGLVATYMFPNEKSSIFYGAAVSHLLAPRDQVVNNTLSRAKLAMRYMFHTGGSFSIKDEYRIMPGFFATYQSKSTQFNLGTSVGFHFLWDDYDRPSGTVFTGLWFRLNEFAMSAFIPQVGLEYNNFKIGFSYDYVTNSMSSGVTGRPNTLELSLSYIFNRNRSTDYSCLYSPYF